MKEENILTRKVLIEKSPKEFSAFIVSGFKDRWYSNFISEIYIVRHCMSEEDMEGTNFYEFNNYYKVTKGTYKGCVILHYDCFIIDALDLVGIN